MNEHTSHGRFRLCTKLVGSRIYAAALTLLASCTQEPPKVSSAKSTPPNQAEKNLQQTDPPELPILSVGVVPQQAASTLAKQWIPLLNYIGNKANARLVFKTASNIPTFEKRCAAGAYDIAYMNPYHYTVYHDQVGYEAIVKRSDSKIKGIIVKKRGSNHQTLMDLDGKKLAFPAPRAFAATLLTTAGLRAAGVEFESEYVSSHESVYLNVARGLFVAGGGIVRTFKNVSPEIRDQLEILWETPSYTPHAFAMHPRVDAKMRAAVTQALIEIDSDEVGRTLLGALNIKNLEAASNQDWDDVRELQIQIR
ncbi:MAG: phosphonate transport system substrate-binding protein [Planctomycetota bacterium]|jgi:phosphonate transport system substrate-binding protein